MKGNEAVSLISKSLFKAVLRWTQQTIGTVVPIVFTKDGRAVYVERDTHPTTQYPAVVREGIAAP